MNVSRCKSVDVRINIVIYEGFFIVDKMIKKGVSIINVFVNNNKLDQRLS